MNDIAASPQVAPKGVPGSTNYAKFYVRSQAEPVSHTTANEACSETHGWPHMLPIRHARCTSSTLITGAPSPSPPLGHTDPT